MRQPHLADVAGVPDVVGLQSLYTYNTAHVVHTALSTHSPSAVHTHEIKGGWAAYLAEVAEVEDVV
jgi:hypothetical protein